MIERKGPGIVWVTSYPKSGNTWVRFLLAHLLFENIESSADVDRFIPSIGGAPRERIVLPEDKPVMLKTHWTLSAVIPLFNETLGFIYVVRNPLDVMLSFFNFEMLRFLRSEQNPSEQRIEDAREHYIDSFIGHRGNPLRGPGGGHTNWSENVRLWRAACERYPSVFIRYEDMLNDTEKEVRRVLQFFRCEVSDQQLQQAIHMSSFESMKEQEEMEINNRQLGFFYTKNFEQAQRHGIRFMHKGKSRNGFQYLSESQLVGFVEAFGPTLDELGYHLDPVTGELQLGEHPHVEVRPLNEKLNFGYARVQPLVPGQNPVPVQRQPT